MSSDLPSAQLLQQAHARPKSGEELELLGKQAAAKYLEGSCPTLNEAVVATVKTAGLAPEQVRRVVEFANTDAFLQEFKKESASSKVVTFEGGPANYSDILKDLNDGGGGTVFDPGNGDYHQPPPSTVKTAQLNMERLGIEDTKLAEAFAVDESPLPFAEPLVDSLDLKEKLARAYEVVSSEISILEGQYLGAIDDLYTQVKQASLGGTSLGQIVVAWSTITDEPAFVKAAFAQITPKLIETGVFFTKEAIGESLEKTANSGLVNPQHPLVGSYRFFCDTLIKLADNRRAQQELAVGLDQLTTFLKQASVASSAKDVIVKTVRAAEKAAPKVGKGVGKGAEIATKYSPHAAASYVGYEGYQKAKKSPTIHKALSYIPGTRQHQVRKYYESRAR